MVVGQTAGDFCTPWVQADLNPVMLLPSLGWAGGTGPFLQELIRQQNWEMQFITSCHITFCMFESHAVAIDSLFPSISPCLSASRCLSSWRSENIEYLEKLWYTPANCEGHKISFHHFKSVITKTCPLPILPHISQTVTYLNPAPFISLTCAFRRELV